MMQSVRHYVYDNGFQLCVIPSITPMTTVSLVADAGSLNDPCYSFGLAHFVEHIMLSKTENHNSWVTDALTSKDTITIVTHTAGDDILSVMKYYRDLLTSYIVTQQIIAHEKEIIKHELVYYKSHYEQRLDDILDVSLFGEQVGHSVLGNDETLSRFQENDIAEYLGHYMLPDRMVLIVISHENPEKIRDMGLDCFAELPSMPRDYHTSELYRPKIAHVSLDIGSSSVINELGIGLNTNTSTQRIALGFIAFLLGGKSENSILAQELREKSKKVYGISASYVEYGIYSKIAIKYICEKTDQEQCLQRVSNILKSFPVTDYSREWERMVINNLINYDNRTRYSILLGKSYLFQHSYDWLFNSNCIPITLSELSSVYSEFITNHLE